MKLLRSTLTTTRHATAVFCMMLVLLATVIAQKQTPAKNTQPQKAVAQAWAPVPVAPSCGATLDLAACYKLTNDVVCPPAFSGVAITLDNNNGFTPVLYLNGHRIVGAKPPVSGSVGVELQAFDEVTGGPPVNGLGTITGFDTGIVLAFDHNTVTHVHLIANNTGINDQSGGNTIGANTFRRNSCAGIRSACDAGDEYIVDNLVTGSNGAACSGPGTGIYVGGGTNNTYISGNWVNHNTIGMSAPLALPDAAISVSGNDFSYNLQQGASISFVDGITVSNNWFNSNGQDGLSLDNVFSGSLIQNNFAYSNKRYGIALTNSDDTGLSPDQLTGNVALGNSVFDLYESASPANTWSNNTCDTGSPAALFPCPLP